MDHLSHQQARAFVQARAVVQTLIDAVLETVDPAKIVRSQIQRTKKKRFLTICDKDWVLDNGSLFVISIGKAAIPMFQAVHDVCADLIYAGAGISKQAVAAWPAQNDKIKFYQGNHPVPGQDSILATTAVLDLLSQTREDDLVLCLISGGTSALLTQPLIRLEDWQALNQALLASGCTIREFNTLRRQLDQVKGGGLAHFAAPAAVISLIISDVVGDDLAAIGSGPTVFIEETPQASIDILRRYDIESVLDTAVFHRILNALQTTPKAVSPLVPDNIIISSVSIAAKAAEQQAKTSGFQSKIITTHLEGEAREAGNFAAAIAKDLLPGECVILGGETTVTLTGDGTGGRNLELALAAAIALEGWQDVALATFATDGDDGPTGAAGAVVTGECIGYGREQNLDARQYLANNDSYTYFKLLDDAGYGPHLIITGKTGNNVNDLIFIMKNPGNS